MSSNLNSQIGGQRSSYSQKKKSRESKGCSKGGRIKNKKADERRRICSGTEEYVGQGESEMRGEEEEEGGGVKEEDEKLSAGDFACVF